MATREEVIAGSRIQNNETNEVHTVLKVEYRRGALCASYKKGRRHNFVRLDRIHTDGHARSRGYNLVTGIHGEGQG